MGNESSSSQRPIFESDESDAVEERRPEAKAPAHAPLPLPKNGFLFAQFPNEINYMIVNFLDADTLIKTSGTCKLWRANTQYLENLSIRVTSKSIRELIDDGRMVKRPRTRLADINWKPLEATLKRFNPERLRSLHLYPDLEQTNEVVNSFIARAVNVTKLVVTSYYQMEAIQKLPTGQLREISFSSTFDARCTRFVNLESIGFNVVQNQYSDPVHPLQFRGFKHLRRLCISYAAEPYISLEQLGRLVHLKEIELDYAYLPDEHFLHLARLTNLEVLKLSHLQKEIPIDDSRLDMSEAHMAEIGNANPISGLRHLTKLVNLTYLDVSRVQKTYSYGDEAPEGYDIADLVINHFTKLREIDISCTALGKANRKKLKEISWLNVVDVKDTFDFFNVDQSGEQNDDDALQAELHAMEN